MEFCFRVSKIDLISTLLFDASMVPPSQRTKQSVDGPRKDHFLCIVFFSFCEYVCCTDSAVVFLCVFACFVLQCHLF